MVKFLKRGFFRHFFLDKNVNFVIFIVDNVLMYKILSTSIQPKDCAILWLFFFSVNYCVFSMGSFLVKLVNSNYLFMYLVFKVVLYTQ